MAPPPEVLHFFLNEPPREQLQLVRFALEPDNKDDLASAGRAGTFGGGRRLDEAAGGRPRRRVAAATAPPPRRRHRRRSVALGFQVAYAGSDVVRGAPQFDDEILVQLLVLDLENQHVAALRPYAAILHVLVARPPNLRRALRARAVGVLLKRLRGQPEAVVGAPPTARSRSVDACRALLAALLFGAKAPQPNGQASPRLEARGATG